MINRIARYIYLNKYRRHDYKNNKAIHSFDLFDTLITRIFDKPDQLFYYIEHIYKATGFAKCRIEAEKKANTLYDEVTLEHIYHLMDNKYHVFKDIEVNEDVKSTKPIHDNIKRFNLCQRKIIITDTYYTKSEIHKFIKKNNIVNYDDLFVSSEYNASKVKGNMYNVVSYKYKDIIYHTGDNLTSDVKNAFKYSIRPLFYQNRPIYKDINIDITNGIISDKLKLDLSILNKLQYNIEYDRTYENLFTNIGYLFSGPVVYTFCCNILEACKSKKIDDIIFVSRDAYYLNKYISKHKSLNSSYLHLNRSICQKLENNKEIAHNYFKHLSKTKKYLLVDAATNNYSAQRILNKYGINTCGMYWLTGRVNKDLDYLTLNALNQKNKNHSLYKYLEFLLSSPENIIADIAVNDKYIKLIPKIICNKDRYYQYAQKYIGIGIDKYYKYHNQYLNKEYYYDANSINIWTNNITNTLNKYSTDIKTKLYTYDSLSGQYKSVIK